jgi:hypothetical protein
MPSGTPANLVKEFQKLNPSGDNPWFIKFTAPGGSPQWRFTNYKQDTTFQSLLYTAASFTMPSIDAETEGTVPTLAVTVSGLGLYLQEALRDHDNLREATFEAVQVNTDFMEADYSDETVILAVRWTENRIIDVVFHLGLPVNLMAAFPADVYESGTCRHTWMESRCGYVRPAIEEVDITAGRAVRIKQTGHPYETGDGVTLKSVAEIVPSLDGDYGITVVDADWLALDGTDGGSYSGSFVSGVAGFTTCDVHRTICKRIGQITSFGANRPNRHGALEFGIRR